MASKPYARGKRAELELARILWRNGFAVMRAPASGARAKRVPWPDIVAVRRERGGCRALVFEVKLRSKRNTIYISGWRARSLAEYARRMGAEAYVAVKVASEGRWFVFPLDRLRRQLVDGEPRYEIAVRDYDDALTIEDLLAGRPRITRPKATPDLEDTEITE